MLPRPSRSHAHGPPAVLKDGRGPLTFAANRGRSHPVRDLLAPRIGLGMVDRQDLPHPPGCPAENLREA